MYVCLCVLIKQERYIKHTVFSSPKSINFENSLLQSWHSIILLSCWCDWIHQRILLWKSLLIRFSTVPRFITFFWKNQLFQFSGITYMNLMNLCLGAKLVLELIQLFRYFAVYLVLWCTKKREHNSQNCHNLDFENWWHLWPVICFGGHYSGKKVLIFFQWALLSIPWVLLRLKENQTLMKIYKKMIFNKKSNGYH